MRRRRSRKGLEARLVKPLPGRGAPCPVMNIEVTADPGEYVRAIARTIDGEYLGSIGASAEWAYGTLDVRTARVKQPRCGIGTRLYEALAKWACREGLRMSSDTRLSTDSHGFWSKQERKGRARWNEAEERFELIDTCTASRDLSGMRRRRVR